MGLSKRMTLQSGVTVNYHRIASVTHEVGVGTWVEVASYTSQAKRQDEGAAFCERAVHLLGFDDTMTLTKAYEWLKAQDAFDGAKDALEGE